MLIALEGLDASGKTTQAQLIYEYAISRGHETGYMSFPNYTSWSGRLINDYLAGVNKYSQIETNLLYSLNRYGELPELEKLLDRNEHVILNRYYFSNMAYGSFDGCEELWIHRTDKYMPKPDVTFYLDLPAHVSFERNKIKKHDINEMNLEYLQKVRANYKRIAMNFGMKVINANRIVEQVTNDILCRLPQLK